MLKKGLDSVTTYYQKAKLLRDTLATIGKTLSHTEFNTYLLAGLGSNFDSMVTSIITRVDPLTTSQIYKHLLTHKARLARQLTSITSSPEFSANLSFKNPILIIVDVVLPVVEEVLVLVVKVTHLAISSSYFPLPTTQSVKYA